MIEIAKILKPQGTCGEVKAQLFSDNFDGFEERGFAYIKTGDSHRRIGFRVTRSEPPFVFLRIEGIETRSDAEKICGVFLYLDREELDEPGAGEYYITDMIDIEVTDENGKRMGKLTEVLQHGAADVYVIKGDKNFMFPALKRVIRSVDIKKGCMVIDAEALKEVAVYDDL